MSITVRPATEEDLPIIGRLGTILLRTHYEFDRARFLVPDTESEAGYTAFLTGQLGKESVALLVAEREREVLGYVYASIEPHSYTELRNEAGFIHDVAVAQGRRGAGVAQALIDAALGWFRQRSTGRVMLWTAERNAGAQHFFAKLGFRRTMVEMTREL